LKLNDAVRRDVRRWGLGVVISLTALYVVFRLADWQELLAALASIRTEHILAASALTVLFIAVRALAWRVLLNGRPTFRQAFFIVSEGYLLNNILPLRAGEFGRAVFMGRALGVNAFHVLSTIVIERAFDLAIAAGLLLSTLPLALEMGWARSAAVLVLVLVITGLGVLYFMALKPQLINGIVERIGRKSDLFQRLIAPQITALMDGFQALTRPAQFFTSLLLVIVSWVVAVTTYYVIILSVAPDAPFWWGIFTDAMLALGISLPSAPGALGMFEGAIVAALTLLGVSNSAALALAIVLHFIQYLITGLIGGYGLLKEGQSLGALFSQLRLRDKVS